MRTKIATVPLVLIAFLCGGAALAEAGNRNLASLARMALQGGSAGTVAALRQVGPAGMNGPARRLPGRRLPRRPECPRPGVRSARLRGHPPLLVHRPRSARRRRPAPRASRSSPCA